uniref:Uncharacterized protein n=1 Tax=Siphoviridae sp. ctg4a4 TaxID=2825602 RepID=A0A8S5V5M1_9CAUD|nr:MAG TPA: hypothetical protein [Siphoviridae sp. ctg4a4]
MVGCFFSCFLLTKNILQNSLKIVKYFTKFFKNIFCHTIERLIN